LTVAQVAYHGPALAVPTRLHGRMIRRWRRFGVRGHPSSPFLRCIRSRPDGRYRVRRACPLDVIAAPADPPHTRAAAAGSPFRGPLRRTMTWH